MTPRPRFRLRLFAVGLVTLLLFAPAAVAAPEGQLTWAVHVALAPTWFDPAETSGIVTPFMVLYALHDALVKPMPGNPMAPSLAERWTASPDGLAYEFVLRKGVRFHNGDPLTADDVKFSFERYRGVSAKLLKDKVRQVQVVDPQRVRFMLKDPWPDFLTFYATPATGAAWIVPRKYLEKVGDDGFKKAPVGAGPYRFVSFTPGVELVLEANEQYWRKAPSVKRLVLKVVVRRNHAGRDAEARRGRHRLHVPRRRRRGSAAHAGAHVEADALQRGVLDHVHGAVGRRSRRGRIAACGSRSTTRSTAPAMNQSADARLLAAHRQHHSARLRLRAGRAPLYAYDPRAREAAPGRGGVPERLRRRRDADRSVVRGDRRARRRAILPAIGIRTRLRTLERAAFYTQLREKKIRPLVFMASAAAGNAATRLDAFVAAGGIYTYGGYPDIEGLIQEQAVRARSQAPRGDAAPDPAAHARARDVRADLGDRRHPGATARASAESALGLITGFPWSAPYEELKLKSR